MLPSVDFQDADQSHFNSAAYWRRGIVGQSFDPTGWLGRTLDIVGIPDNPLQGISTSWAPDPVLASRRAATATVYDPSGFDFYIEGVWGSEGFSEAYRHAAAGATSSAALAAARRTYANAFKVRDQLAPLRVDDDHPLPPVPVAYPDTDLGTGLRNLARMLGAGFGTRVAALSLRRVRHPRRPAGRARRAADRPLRLARRVAGRPDAARARRPRPDAHLERVRPPPGGQRVERHRPRRRRPGDGGRRPRPRRHPERVPRALARLDEDDNLLVTTEFRTVYATLLESWLGVEAARVLPEDRRRPPAARRLRAAGAAPGGCYPARPRGRLAQLGEHQLDKLGVTGSSPVTPTSESPASRGFSVPWERGRVSVSLCV